MSFRISRAVVLAASLSVVGVASADLALSYQFVGNGNWSLDGVGSNAIPTGVIDAFVPAGSVVERAFLYSATIGPLVGDPQTPTVRFEGVDYAPAAWTYLGSTNGGGAGQIQAYRVDVTSQVSGVIGSGGGTFNFDVEREEPTALVDGEVLAVVYSNPAEAARTIAFLDGASNTDGDGFTFTAADPLPDPTTPGFEALMSAGIGFSAQEFGPQLSHIDVNGRRLTSAAGGADDGSVTDGALLTIGGLGDSTANPADPNLESTDQFYDDELYNLAVGNGANPAPFITTGETVLNIATENPSDNDNIFFVGFNITADGSVPEPTTLGLLGAVGAIALRRRVK